MSKNKETFDFNLPTLDDLFSTQEERDDAKLERVKILPVKELVPFKDHPFKILDDEDMHKLIESIKEYGVYTPLMARPLPDGMLWSSVFVTLMAKKYRFMQFELDMVFDTH